MKGARASAWGLKKVLSLSAETHVELLTDEGKTSDTRLDDVWPQESVSKLQRFVEWDKLQINQWRDVNTVIKTKSSEESFKWLSVI